MFAVNNLHSQPVPGWVDKSNIDNSNSNTKNINNSTLNKIDSAFIKSAVKNNKIASKNLSEEEQREVQKLQQRDREVRAHEMAHQSAGGQYAGSASYDYTTGPDNRRYAVGGSVNIDTSPENSAEKTLKKAEQIKKAATAPAQPSSKDLQIAAKASRMKMEAQAELNKQEDENNNKTKYDYNNTEKNNVKNIYLINKRNSSYMNSSKKINLKIIAAA